MTLFFFYSYTAGAPPQRNYKNRSGHYEAEPATLKNDITINGVTVR